MKSVTVGVPVYFNEGSLPELGSRLERLGSALLERSVLLEVVFVDDGSGDGSYPCLVTLQKTMPRVTVCRHTRNFGAVVATKTALAHATGDAFVILAADLQDPPELVLELVDRWLAGQRYVICKRRSRQDPQSSRIFSALYYRMVRRFVSASYPEGGFDLSLIDRQLMGLAREAPKNVNFVMFIHWLGFEPVVIEYDRQAREHGKSRWTFWKKVKLFADTFLGFSVVPIRMITAVGAIVSVGSFAYGVLVLVGAVFGAIPVEGFATIVVLITFLLGLIIIFLGIIAEYLWRILYEVNRLPESVVDSVVQWRRS